MLAVRTVLILCWCLLPASCRHRVASLVPVATGGPVVLPSGTVLAIIATEPIDSSQPSVNRAYSAVISRDTKWRDPQGILPSGSPATLVLIPLTGNGPQTWQLGLSSVMLNGDSFLVKGDDGPNAPLGTFLGGVPGRDYSDPSKRQPGEPAGLSVSDAVMHILPGSLLTFRLQREITLTGSAH